jgi:hypothetical protein
MENQQFVRRVVGILLTIAFGLVSRTAHAQIDVLTYRYDGARTGANLAEKKLTPANVNVDTFGKLYSYPVDGAVYAQPLYLTGVTIGGVLRNVLYVVTMNDKVYAFDADSASPSPLWMTDLTSPPAVTAVPMTDIVNPSTNIFGNVGIESTPVIDRPAGMMYLVARTKENGSYFQRLHALDIATGRERTGSPTTIAASVPGSAADSTLTPTGRVITFDPRLHQQRAALALTNGVVLVAWAGHEDKPPYHGWIMGFDTTTLALVTAFAVVPDAYGGGVWQGGRAPTIDAAGNAYFATGNGIWDGARNFGDSLLKFSVSRTELALVDYFTPSNFHTLDINDGDLSGSGFTLLPGSNLLLGGGKEGVLYLLDSTNLGHMVANDLQIPQKIPVNGGHVMGGPVYWTSAAAGPLVYNWSEADVLVAWQFANGKVSTSAPYAQGTIRSPGHPGGSLTISANGSTAKTAIVWASIPTNHDAKHILTPGTLRAFDAETLTEIWNSDQNYDRDRVGTTIKFVPPLVVNGKVFLSNHDGGVGVYGLLPPDFSVAAKPAAIVVPPGSSGTFSTAVRPQGGFAATVSLTATANGAPAGTTVSVAPQSVTASGTATVTVTLPASAAATVSFTVTVTGTSGALVHPANPVAVTGSGTAKEIVLYAKDAAPIVGAWQIVDDVTAAGQARIENPDLGAAKVPTPLASPANYFEMTFTPEANVPYRLWLRGRAQKDSYNNDSVYVQFSGSITDTGSPINRIGSTQAAAIILEDCSGCGVAGWGWQDDGYGTNILGPLMYFAAGPQTIRIQQREDGISIDQIVLSAVNYLTSSPGLTKSDTTILPATTTQPPITGTIVRYATDVTTIVGNWQMVGDPTAAGGSRIENPDAGAAKIPTPIASPANYFELAFTAQANTAYRLWIRGRAQNNSYNNDSVYLQFSGSVTSTGSPVNRINSTEAVPVVLEDCSGCGVAGWGWQDNGYGTGVLGPQLYFTAGPQTIRVQQREDGISIDQIVLSPDTYLSTSPGATKNDTIILAHTP